MHSHSASYPPSAKVPSTRPNPRLSRAETFSMTTALGRNSRMILAMWKNKPDRSPSSPRASPHPTLAMLRSWQGKPPAITSTLWRFLPPPYRTSVTFLFACGKFVLKMRRQSAFFSTCQTVVNPARSKPRSIPPIPAKELPRVSVEVVFPVVTWETPSTHVYQVGYRPLSCRRNSCTAQVGFRAPSQCLDRWLAPIRPTA